MGTSAGQCVRSGLGIAALAIALGACSPAETDSSQRNSAGAVVSGGEVGVLRLQVGDCIPRGALESETSDSPSEASVTEVESLQAVPCDQPHGGEVVAVNEDEFSDLEDMPTSDALLERADESCFETVRKYTGFDPDEAQAAADRGEEVTWFASYPLVPTEESWDQGDRGMICIAITVDESYQNIVETTGSAKAPQ